MKGNRRSYNILLYICISIILFASKNVPAQNDGQATIDSVLKQLPIIKTDTSKINAWNTLAGNFQFTNPDSGIIFANLALEKSKQIQWAQGEVKALSELAANYTRKGVYDKALSTFNEAINKAKDIRYTSVLASIYRGKATAFYFLNDTLNELEYTTQALNLDIAMKDIYQMATDYNALGSYYNARGQQEKSIECYMLALKYAQQSNNQRIVAYAYSNAGTSYQAMGQYKRSLEYHLKALVIEKEMGDIYGIATEYGSISQDFIRMYNAQNPKQTTLIDSAIHYANLGIEFCKKCDNLTDMADMTATLSEAYKLKGDYQKSLEVFEEATRLKDSIFNIDKAKLIHDVETKHQINLLNKDKAIQQQEINKQKVIRNAVLLGLGIVSAFLVLVFVQRNKIKKEKNRSDELLLNILPSEVAEELKNKGSSEARDYELATVMFTDFKDFTKISEQLSPAKLLEEINFCFSAFDKIIQQHGIEKIKTIGDAYMCAGGLPVKNLTHATDTVQAAIKIIDFMNQYNIQKATRKEMQFEIRIGINTGPVVAGIVGVKKFAYDIWGDTVNISSRMESNGEVGKVNISGSTYELVKDKFTCVYRGKIEAKNKGEIDMYFVEE